MNPRNPASLAAALVTALALTACGGDNGSSPPAATNPPPAAGGGPPPAASNTPPASASADSAGFVAYLQGLLGLRSESAEPVNVSSFTAPLTDSSDAVAVR